MTTIFTDLFAGNTAIIAGGVSGLGFLTTGAAFDASGARDVSTLWPVTTPDPPAPALHDALHHTQTDAPLQAEDCAKKVNGQRRGDTGMEKPHRAKRKPSVFNRIAEPDNQRHRSLTPEKK